MVKALCTALLAALLASSAFAAEEGFVVRLGVGSSKYEAEVSGLGRSAKTTGNGGTFDIYGGYRMQNAQFGLSCAIINCDGCAANYVLASGAFVADDLHENLKPYLGLGLGAFRYREGLSSIGLDDFDDTGMIGTANLGVNIEFDHLFFGAELRQRLFGEAEQRIKYRGYTFAFEVALARTFLFHVGYKF